MEEHEKPWAALSTTEVCSLFKEASFDWWIAGGIAVELNVGETIRDHGDIDVFLFRQDQIAVQTLLSGWDLWVADPPGRLRKWELGESLALGVQDVFCRRSPSSPWCLQLMFDESKGRDWVSRKSPLVHQPISSIGRKTLDGVPYLAPHIILFYKAKSPSGKHNQDFEALLNSGVDLDSAWLNKNIQGFYGSDHPWLQHMTLS